MSELLNVGIINLKIKKKLKYIRSPVQSNKQIKQSNESEQQKKYYQKRKEENKKLRVADDALDFGRNFTTCYEDILVPGSSS